MKDFAVGCGVRFTVVKSIEIGPSRIPYPSALA